jgi:SAM-dependent methyltransferase
MKIGYICNEIPFQFVPIPISKPMALYSDLAEVYDIMYQKLFDYEQESEFYRSQLDTYHCKSIIEFGCGTGNLGVNLINAGYDYFGVDISTEMIVLAKKRISDTKLSVGNIVDFRSESIYDAACFSGRSISYLVEDNSILEAFKTVSLHLKPNGIFIFDPIDGDQLFENFDTGEKIVEVFPYIRHARSKPLDHKKYTWEWTSEYYQQEGNTKRLLGKDTATVRAFDTKTLEPILSLAGFEIIHIIPKTSYIWDDHYYICQKK